MFIIIDTFGVAIVATDDDGYNYEFDTRKEAEEFAEENYHSYKVIDI